MGKGLRGIAAAVVAATLLIRAAGAETVDVGKMAAVQRTVYGTPPQDRQTVKRKGDPVAFQEAIETLDGSAALIRFIDDSKLTLGSKSKVVIDAFVFDPATVKGNALIDISVGTLRFVTGQMPKGGTVIKTPTATLTLRGTDVVVHVHPDGTTDTAVHEGQVDAHNNVTDENTSLMPGDGATLGEGGTNSLDQSGGDPGDLGSTGGGAGGNDDPPEHRRSDQPKPPKMDPPSEPSASGDDDDECSECSE